MCQKVNDRYSCGHVDPISISYCEAKASGQGTCAGTEIETNSKTEKCTACTAAEEEEKKRKEVEDAEKNGNDPETT